MAACEEEGKVSSPLLAPRSPPVTFALQDSIPTPASGQGGTFGGEQSPGETSRLSKDDRDAMEKLIAPVQRFDDLIRVDDRTPEVFIPADTHHYDDEDYSNHRRRVYPHMHQPLKSLEPRLLRRVKDRIRSGKEAERKAALAGVATVVPEILHAAKAAGVPNIVVQPVVPSTYAGGAVEELVETPAATLPAKKKKRRRHRSKKQEPFFPTLGHLSEESGGTTSSSGQDEVDADAEEESDMEVEMVQPQLDEMYWHEIGAASVFHSGARQLSPTLPSIPSESSSLSLEAACPLTSKPSFLEEIACEDAATPLSYLELTGPIMSRLPALDLARTDYGRIMSMPSISSAKAHPDLSPELSGAKMGRKISFADDNGSPFKAARMKGQKRQDGDQNVNNSERKASFHLGKPRKTSGEDSFPSFTGKLQPEAGGTPTRQPRPHHHREHYRARDLRERTFSGIELRELCAKNAHVTDIEERGNLGDADLSIMHSHRFEELPGRRRHRIHKNSFVYGSPTMGNESNAQMAQMVHRGENDPGVRWVSPRAYSSNDIKQQDSTTDQHTTGEHPVFVEMDVLRFESRSQQWRWREKSRWVRYEEDFNEEAERFDPAHSPPLKFHALLQFRRYLEKGTVILDVEANSLHDVIDAVVGQISKLNMCAPEECYAIREVLHLRHIHVGEKVDHDTVDPGDGHHWGPDSAVTLNPIHSKQQRSATTPANLNMTTKSSILWKSTKSSTERCDSNSDVQGSRHSFRRRKGHHHTFKSDLDGRLTSGTESVSVNVGVLDGLKHPIMVLVRLSKGLHLDHMTEVNVPLRFFFVFLGPHREDLEYTEAGRVIATMMVDETFRMTAYAAQNKDDILEGLRVFLDNSVVVPIWPDITARSLGGMLTQMKTYKRELVHKHKQQAAARLGVSHVHSTNGTISIDMLTDGDRSFTSTPAHQAPSVKPPSKSDTFADHHSDTSAQGSLGQRCRTLFWPPFASLTSDIGGYRDRLRSDFADAWKKDNIALTFLAIIFVYFAQLAPAITFGALLNQVVPEITVTLSLVASGVQQLLFTLIGGQPMIILGVTGPIFIMENTIDAIAKGMEVSFLALRFWVSVYTSVIGLVVVGFNLTNLVRFVRRSVEEIFNSFVGFFYIFKALLTMKKLIPTVTSTAEQALAENATMTGTGQPQQTQTEKSAVAAVTFFLAFLMLIVCLLLAQLKRGRYFRRKMRNFLGSFNVPLGIFAVILLERCLFTSYGVHTLNVPPSGTVNISLWVSFPPWREVADAKIMTPWVHGFAVIVALCLVLIISTETGIAGISVAKSERKTEKPCLFALDFFSCLVVLPLMAGCFGWPFVTGAVVRSSSHVIALTRWDQKMPPGVPHRIIGCVEQRVTGIAVGLLVFLSIFLGSLLHHIPMAAMYGMFLYMGVMTLRDLQLTRRLLALLKRRKHWPETDYLRDLPSKHLLVFGVIQIIVILGLILLNCIAEFWPADAYASLGVPFVLMGYALSREFLLPKWKWLSDHLDQMDRTHRIHIHKKKVVTAKHTIYTTTDVVDLSSSSESELETEYELKAENPYPHA